jgi:hypothetical protein
MAGHSTDGVTPIECSHCRDSESNVLSERGESKDPSLRSLMGARRSSLLLKVSFNIQGLLKKFLSNSKLGCLSTHMGAAYYIVLEREIDGLDSFVNGKAVARESDRLESVTKSIGLRDINEFVSANPDDLVAMAEGLGIELPVEPPPEAWFAAEEGLGWVSQLRRHVAANANEVDDADAVLADLAEYCTVLEAAQASAVRWHFAVDF